MFVNYIKVKVYDDDEAYKTRGFSDLREYGMHALDTAIASLLEKGHQVVPMNVIETWGSYEVQPVMCNSGTWYTRSYLNLVLWYGTDVKPEMPEVVSV